MVTVKLYVEGGGDSKSLKTACRSGFSAFLQQAGLRGKMPRVVACGSRRNAYESFCTALQNGESACLLVDSEAMVSESCKEGDTETWKPWLHLSQREGDHWPTPENASQQQCHLMVQCMESWFLADRTTLKAFFGQGFNSNLLPDASRPIEDINKDTVYSALRQATCHCKTKHQYAKGEHSFKLLQRIDPQKVTEASSWAKRFINDITKIMDSR